jgi:16S rRNA (cytidine1402-2'-O)-methyltransferase
MSTLYLVATPIGNLQDMTPRAIAVLRDVTVIAAEDTRHSGRLLAAFGIETPMISYHEHNRVSRESGIIQRLAAGDVAVISDAGMPGISDPGVELVRAAHAAGHRVVPVPGPSSLIAAVAASGIVPGPFLYTGFLPRDGEARRAEIARMQRADCPAVIFESPHRLGETLRDLAAALGDREAAVARELTKLHEEIVRGTLVELADRFDVVPKGEIVIVIGDPVQRQKSEASPEAVVRQLLADGLKPSKAAREAASILGIAGSEAYALVRRIASDTSSNDRN